MTSHKFVTQIAIDFDVETALLLDTISFWLQINFTNKSKKHFNNGKWWLYNSYDSWTELFPYYTAKQMRRILANAESNDLIITGNYNKRESDLTKWYTLTDKALDYYPLLKAQLLNTPAQMGKTPAQMGKTPAQMGNALPDTYPDTNPYKELHTNLSESNDSKPPATSKIQLRDLIDVYHDLLPDNPKHNPRAISTELEKTLQTLIKRWPEIDSNKNPLTVDKFRSYITGLKETAPTFTLGQYETPSGRVKKNNLVTFAKWNTVVKFTEGSYS